MASSDAVFDPPATADNCDSHQLDFSPPKPARNSPLKRRSPSSNYSLADAVPGFHRLASEGYQFHHLPAGNSDLKDPSCLSRCFALNCALGKTTKKSLFPPSAAQSLPPPRALARTASAPTSFTNSILTNSPYQASDSTLEPQAVKRLKRADSADKLRQHIKDMIDQIVQEATEAINAKIPPEIEIPAEKTINTKEALPQEEPVEKDMEEDDDDDLEAEADLVKAKRVGDCTMLEFKCKCGSGYSVGIIGNSFFYKLL